MGKVTTYGALAEALHCGSSQAIGQAMRHNPYAQVRTCLDVSGCVRCVCLMCVSRVRDSGPVCARLQRARAVYLSAFLCRCRVSDVGPCGGTETHAGRTALPSLQLPSLLLRTC